MKSSKITVDLHDAYSGHDNNRRGLQFTYSVNEPIDGIPSSTADPNVSTESTQPGYNFHSFIKM